MSDNLFLNAARKRYRFGSARGELTVEQLFDLPLTSANGFDLNNVAINAYNELNEATGVSFVETPGNSAREELAERLEIIKAVIAIRKAEAQAATDRAARASLKLQLRRAIQEKRDQQLSAASLEELEAQLASLDAPVEVEA